MRLLKERGDIDRVELVKELLVDSGHLDGDLVGDLFLTEGEPKFRCDDVPEIRAILSHRSKYI